MRVAIIHPWFPQYRLPFFEKLIREANCRGFQLHIYYGDTPREWSARGDSLNSSVATRLPTKFLHLGSKDLGFKSLKRFNDEGPFDLVIVEQAVRNLETYLLLLRYPKKRLAFWGHGKTYTAAIHPLQEALKHLLVKRSSWFFAYTPGGAQAIVEKGYQENRVTTLFNSIDTEDLAASVAQVSDDDRKCFRDAHGLSERTALFIGGLDESKRLPFLITAADAISRSEPDFRLLILGDGSHRGVVDRALPSRPWLVYLGRADGKNKALALSAAGAIAMPGRVGLVAVDSFAARLPIVTTAWPFHAPEFEYLTSGFNSYVSSDSTEAFAAALRLVLYDGSFQERLRSGARESAALYTIDNMVTRFADGIAKALGGNA